MELYNDRYYRASKKFQFNKPRLDELVTLIQRYKPESVLDVGCGLGALVYELRKNNIRAVGVDSSSSLQHFWKKDVDWFHVADAGFLPFEYDSFDLVFSSDFFEHIPEEKIETVKNEMLRVGNVVLARVAYEAPLTKKQAMYHVTNMPKDWWEKKLEGIILV